MKSAFKALLFGILISVTSAQEEQRVQSTTQDSVAEFIDLLESLSSNSDNEYFIQHCNAILNVIQARTLTAYESTFVKKMFITFSDTNVQSNGSILDSYKEKKRPFIISWVSPADNGVSLAWLLLPTNWNPEIEYPLYVTLHGLYQPYSNPVEYMARYLSPDLVVDKSFDDGILQSFDSLIVYNWSTSSMRVDQIHMIPLTNRLFQNYPNPFNPVTTITYKLLNSYDVSLTIRDQLGRKVTCLVNKNQSQGVHRIDWDASKYACGMYFYTIKSSNYFGTKKMVLLK